RDWSSDVCSSDLRVVEAAVGPGRCAPLRELIQLGGRLLLLGKGAETEQLEAAAQEVVVAPIVHHRQGLGRVEVVVEGGCQLAPRAAWLRRVAEDLAEAVRARLRGRERLVRVVHGLTPMRA